MTYFLDTVETVPAGVGFSHFDGTHLCWLAVAAAVIIGSSLWYRKADPQKREAWRRTVALLLLADEVFKMVMLTIGHRFLLSYLPLHLCSINIFLIAFHVWKPNKTLDAFLYTVCIPGALAALLFPTWVSLPFGNFMHLHSFTVHILLILYPIVLTVGGDIQVSVHNIPKCLALLLGMAVPIYVFNLIFDENFMFLMYAEEGNPLYLFQQAWGSHLWGFPVIIAGVLIVMYLPWVIREKIKTK